MVNVYGFVHRNNILVYESQHISADIVEELEIFHDSSRQQYCVMVTGYCSYSCFVLLKMGDSDARNM
jgi:hypothetical protein